MKKYFAIAVMSVVLLSSCKDFLSTAPANQIASENMWTTESLADAGMDGLYRIFYPDVSGTGNVYINSSFDGLNKYGWMSMEYQTWSRYGVDALTKPTKSATDVAVSHEWKWCYTGIHRVNDALENLDKAGLSDEKYDRYMCEAKFLRAWLYSRLNQIYQGVPLYLETVSNEECTKGQSTAEEVWEQVISDLTDCIESENLPDNTLTTNYGRPSKGAAYSLRGIAYMWMAWLGNEDNSYYQLAANDFEKVDDCGYGLWTGKIIDFFNYTNEKDHEMIFPVQYNEDVGFCDNLQFALGPRDCYYGYGYYRPSYDFVSSFQNADGSEFKYEDVIPEWNDDVFVNDISKREIFFLRDSISLDSDNNVVPDFWSESEAATLSEKVADIGVDIFKKYYLKDGNEDRVRSLYVNRDPRLNQLILTPYEKVTCYYYKRNDGEEMVDKELRWPYLRDNHVSGHDFYIHEAAFKDTYVYKKYVYFHKGDLIDANPNRCPTDWPLIRYTDVYLRLAECYVHLGRLSEAAAIVNEIRARSDMPAITVGSSDQVMEAVRYERRVELCLEGHDFFDEWRWGTYKEMKFNGQDVYGDTTLWGQYEGVNTLRYYTDDMYPWSAPASECERNPNLTRKEGWSY